jgi:hypothetical protein
MSHRRAKPRPMLPNVTTVAKRRVSHCRVGGRRRPVRSLERHLRSRPSRGAAGMLNRSGSLVRFAPAALGTGWHKTKRESDSNDVDVERCWIVENRTSKCELTHRKAIACQGQAFTSDFPRAVRIDRSLCKARKPALMFPSRGTSQIPIISVVLIAPSMPEQTLRTAQGIEKPWLIRQ